MDKSKVLIIADRFAPFNGISAIRPSKIAKFLCQNHDCVVDVIKLDREITVADEMLGRDVGVVRDVYTMPLYEAKKATKPHKSALLRKLQSLCQIEREYRCQRKMYRIAKKKMKGHDFTQYDIVFTTFSPLFSHFMGRYVKKKNKNCIWVVDYRDPDPNVIYTNRFVSAIEKRIIWKTTKKADLITGASPYCYTFIPKYSTKQCMTLTNGYDQGDFTLQRKRQNDAFVLSYTGTLYSERQDLTPILFAVARLMSEENAPIELHYAGRQFDAFSLQAKRCGIEDTVVNHGLVTRAESIQLQKDSDLLLIAAWNEENSKDILTGKVYEYMGSEVPVVCTITGSVANSILKKVIEKTQIGYCHENNFDDKEALYAYLKMQYEAYKKDGHTAYTPIKEEIESYEYQTITEQLYSKTVSLRKARKLK
jgi:glycosyltransferase involved in cell wall biosynthesis